MHYLRLTNGGPPASVSALLSVTALSCLIKLCCCCYFCCCCPADEDIVFLNLSRAYDAYHDSAMALRIEMLYGGGVTHYLGLTIWSVSGDATTPGLITAVLTSSSRAFSCVAVIMAPVMHIVLCRSQFGVLEDTMPIYRIAVDPRQRFGSNLSSPSPSSEGLGVVFSAVPESHQESS